MLTSSFWSQELKRQYSTVSILAMQLLQAWRVCSDLLSYGSCLSWHGERKWFGTGSLDLLPVYCLRFLSADTHTKLAFFFGFVFLGQFFYNPSDSPSIYVTLAHTIKNLLLDYEEMCCKETPSFERAVGGIILNDSHYIDDHWIFDYQYAKREHTCVISLLLKPSGRHSNLSKMAK